MMIENGKGDRTMNYSARLEKTKIGEGGKKRRRMRETDMTKSTGRTSNTIKIRTINESLD
jgi:hypothetical protein